MRRLGSAGLLAGRMLPFVRSSAGTPTYGDAAPGAPHELLHWADYFAVAATPRFRALQTARLQDSARHGMVFVVVAALFNCVWLAPFHSDALAFVVGLNTAVGLVAAIGYLWITTRARRHPEAVVFAVLAVIDIATIMLGVDRPELGLVAAGYLLLLPAIVALMVPWRTRTHVAWLASHVVAMLCYTTLAVDAALPGGRDEKLTLLVMATAVSLFGHVIALRARVLHFVQIERIRALNRRARRDAVRLDQLNGILEQTARTDELTGLKNRLSLRRDLRSVGVAVVGPDDLAAADDAWFSRADEALYRAKAGGRNRSESEIPPPRVHDD